MLLLFVGTVRKLFLVAFDYSFDFFEKYFVLIIDIFKT